MKKIIAIILFFLISSSVHNICPQENESSSTGPIPKLRKERIHTVVNPSQNPATIGYGYAGIAANTVSMPVPAGTPFTVLAPWVQPVFASSMVKGPNGVYYMTEIAPALYQFDPGTGAVTLLGNITGMGADQPNGISYNPANGTYYIASSTNLYSFDVGTYIVSLIGPFNTGGLMIDLCFDDAGVCYGYDLGVDNAYTVDIATGNATLLGPLGYDANYGQGMSYDNETGVIYLSAFNNSTLTGQLRTMDPTTGNTTLITDWGFEQVAPFALDTQYGPPCPVGAPSNPNPPNGQQGISINNVTLTWENGVGTTQMELWFGELGNLTIVYNGPPITSYSLPMLNYYTKYGWYVVCKNDTCGTQGPIWSFMTVCDPTFIFEEFNHLNCWTPIGPLGLSNWGISNTNNAGGFSPELRLSWTPSFNGLSKFLSSVFTTPFPGVQQFLRLKHMCDWYADPAPTMGIGITHDAGATYTVLWQFQPVGGNVGPETICFSYTPITNNFQFLFFMNGDSFNIDFWYVDELFPTVLSGLPPAAPSNLTAIVIYNPDPQVQLNWQDNSGNECGFNIFRKPGLPNEPGDYTILGTAFQNLTEFIDTTALPESTYTYVVYSVNPWGTNGSNPATITLPVPVELISFTCEVDENIVTLFWRTATETNNQGFEILRTAQNDIESWERIGFVEGKGTTTEPQSYSFTDKHEPGNYKYRLKQIDFDGSYEYSQAIEAEVLAPLEFSLEQNYPNPFNPITVIKYSIPQTSNVELKVFDILGNEIETLVDEEKQPGSYEVEFNSKGLPSGIYFYQLKAGSYIETKKMILIK